MTQKVDTLLTNAIVLSMDNKLNQYDPGAVAVKGDVIVAVGAEADILKEYSANEIIDCGNKVLMPGLVNAHTHLYQVLLRAVWEDLELMPWLKSPSNATPPNSAASPRPASAAANPPSKWSATSSITIRCG